MAIGEMAGQAHDRGPAGLDLLDRSAGARERGSARGADPQCWKLRTHRFTERCFTLLRSLRYYEQKHMLVSRRTPGGHREYPEAAVDRVILIQQLLAAGLCGEKIASILPCMRDHDGGAAATATPWLVDQLQMERDRIDRSIQDLHYTRDALDEVIATAANTPPTHSHSSVRINDDRLSQ